jgi:hypothetical protein
LRAYELGFVVSKPFGDNSKYDFVVDSGKKISRVQVKSVSKRDTSNFNNRYCLLAAHGRNSKKAYTKKQVDIVVCYVILEDVWYIIPIESLKTIRVSLYPHRTPQQRKYEGFKEAWDLFKG